MLIRIGNHLKLRNYLVNSTGAGAGLLEYSTQKARFQCSVTTSVLDSTMLALS